MMKRLTITALVACLFAPVTITAVQAGGQIPGAVVQIAGCEAGVTIDGSTAEQAKKKIEAAGYTQVHGLMKACDNVWHGVATNKDGVSGNVMLTPQGEVMPEGN